MKSECVCVPREEEEKRRGGHRREQTQTTAAHTCTRTFRLYVSVKGRKKEEKEGQNEKENIFFFPLNEQPGLSD